MWGECSLQGARAQAQRRRLLLKGEQLWGVWVTSKGPVSSDGTAVRQGEPGGHWGPAECDTRDRRP